MKKTVKIQKKAKKAHDVNEKERGRRKGGEVENSQL